MSRSFIARNPSVLWFLLALSVFTVVVTLLSEVTGVGLISTSFVKTLGKTLCLCLIAIAMDVVWGYCGILSLGHFSFFGIGGYAIGMWLMYARTEQIVIASLSGGPLRPTPDEVTGAIGTQIFGVVGSSEIPLIWSFAHSLPLATARDWGLFISTGRGKTSIGIEEPALFSEPGLFLVSPDRSLYFSSVQTMPFIRPSFAELVGALDFVIEKNYPARCEYTGEVA